jgi:hypothetical protein
MWHGRRDRSKADPLDHAETSRDIEHVVGERMPSVVGLGAREHQEVALAESHATDDELRPGQLSEPPIDDLQRGPACAVVEQRIGVERRDIDRLIEQLFERRRRCATGIDPAVERGDQDRRDQVAGIARTARSGQ